MSIPINPDRNYGLPIIPGQRNTDVLRRLLDQVSLGQDLRRLAYNAYYDDDTYMAVITYDERIIISTGIERAETNNLTEYNEIQDTLAGGLIVNMASDAIKFLINQSMVKYHLKEDLN